MKSTSVTVMNIARIFSFVLLGLLLGPLAALAQVDQAAITGRIKARIAQVDQLKLELLVGENNKGFLEQRGQLTPEQTELMNAENQDRRALYNIVASRTGTTVAVVGSQRAEQLRNNSAAGVWLQAADGSWYKK